MKRINIPNAAYFVTTNTQNRITFFDEDIFVEVFLDSMHESITKYESTLIGYKVNPDHIHIILKLDGLFTISSVMHSIKRNASKKINQILSYNRDNERYATFNWSNSLSRLRDRFLEKHGDQNLHSYPLFKWQPSFDDQLIRTKREMNGKIQYLKRQHIHHNLGVCKWLKIETELPLGIRYVGRPSDKSKSY